MRTTQSRGDSRDSHIDLASPRAQNILKSIAAVLAGKPMPVSVENETETKLMRTSPARQQRVFEGT